MRLLDEVADAVRDVSPTFADEYDLQAAVEAVLAGRGWAVDREHVASARDRYDLLVRRDDEAVIVEVKIAGGIPDLERQLARYLDRPGVDGAVLVTSRMRHRAVARELRGKPVVVVVLRAL